MNEFTLDKFLGRYGAVAQRSEPGGWNGPSCRRFESGPRCQGAYAVPVSHCFSPSEKRSAPEQGRHPPAHSRISHGCQDAGQQKMPPAAQRPTGDRNEQCYYSTLFPKNQGGANRGRKTGGNAGAF